MDPKDVGGVEWSSASERPAEMDVWPPLLSGRKKEGDQAKLERGDVVRPSPSLYVQVPPSLSLVVQAPSLPSLSVQPPSQNSPFDKIAFGWMRRTEPEGIMAI